jgi:hypothetical protein
VARAFASGFLLVAVFAALAIVIAWPDPVPSPPPAFASEVQPIPARVGPPPPSREDLIGAICTGYLANVTCEHQLMQLYRACGVDGAHPRTTGCAAVVRHVRRSAAK